jgi:pimeloyl-ACP methyl ester carboxylesterase
VPRLTVGRENDAPIEIHSEDHGSGDPIVLIHGYPLNGNSWERQERERLASGYASRACVDTWLTDFRDDLPKIDIPTIVVHWNEGRILPLDATAKRPPSLIADVKLVAVDGGPHNIGWTHPDEVNRALLDFLED